VGWLISKVTGRTVADLLSELVWKPMGAHYDAYYQLDSAGKDFAGGGLDMNLRDMALLGEMIRNEGYINHKQVIPKKAAKELFGGGSAESFAKGGEYPSLKGWSYHNLWWMTNNKHGAFMARGVHGQAIYIDPVAKMVIARFSSNPLSSNKFIDPLSIPAYEAVADYLVKK
jgi:CubicO group peptidase (beta-lactamase class C family)